MMVDLIVCRVPSTFRSFFRQSDIDGFLFSFFQQFYYILIFVSVNNKITIVIFVL